MLSYHVAVWLLCLGGLGVWDWFDMRTRSEFPCRITSNSLPLVWPYDSVHVLVLSRWTDTVTLLCCILQIQRLT